MIHSKHRKRHNFHKYALYGGTALLEAGMAYLNDPGDSDYYARHFASTPEHAETASRILRGNASRVLPGTRSLASSVHRYSHLPPPPEPSAPPLRGYPPVLTPSAPPLRR